MEDKKYFRRLITGITVGCFALTTIMLTSCKKVEEVAKPPTFSEIINQVENLGSYTMKGNINTVSNNEKTIDINFSANVQDNNFTLDEVKTIIQNEDEKKEIKLNNIVSQDNEIIYLNLEELINIEEIKDNPILNSEIFKGYLQIPYVNKDKYTSNEYENIKNQLISIFEQHVKGYKKADYISYFEYSITNKDEELVSLFSDILQLVQDYKSDLKTSAIGLTEYSRDITLEYIDLYTEYIKNIGIKLYTLSGNYDENEANEEISKTIAELKQQIISEVQNAIDKLPYEIDQNLNGITIADIRNLINNQTDTQNITISIGKTNNNDIIFTFDFTTDREIEDIDVNNGFISNNLKMTITLTPVENFENIQFTPTNITTFGDFINKILEEIMTIFT